MPGRFAVEGARHGGVERRKVLGPSQQLVQRVAASRGRRGLGWDRLGDELAAFTAIASLVPSSAPREARTIGGIVMIRAPPWRRITTVSVLVGRLGVAGFPGLGLTDSAAGAWASWRWVTTQLLWAGARVRAHGDMA